MGMGGSNLVIGHSNRADCTFRRTRGKYFATVVSDTAIEKIIRWPFPEGISISAKIPRNENNRDREVAIDRVMPPKQHREDLNGERKEQGNRAEAAELTPQIETNQHRHADMDAGKGGNTAAKIGLTFHMIVPEHLLNARRARVLKSVSVDRREEFREPVCISCHVPVIDWTSGKKYARDKIAKPDPHNTIPDEKNALATPSCFQIAEQKSVLISSA